MLRNLVKTPNTISLAAAAIVVVDSFSTIKEKYCHPFKCKPFAIFENQ
jgi:hypothetical protein